MIRESGLAFLLVALSCVPVAAQTCTPTMAHLSSSLPRYNDPDLTSVRQAVLDTDLRDALRAAQSQGYTPARAAAAALQQADEYEKSKASAEACIRSASTNPAAILKQLQDGTYRFGSGGITTDCAKGYVVFYYGMIANREAAVGLACLARGR